MSIDDTSKQIAYFHDRAAAAGLSLSEAEAKGLFGLAAWMSDGLAGTVGAVSDEEVLELDIAELVLCTIIDVASADGNISEPETRFIRETAQSFGLDANKYLP